LTPTSDSIKQCKDRYIKSLVDIGIELEEAQCEAQIVLTTLMDLSLNQLLTRYNDAIGSAHQEFDRVLAARLQRMPLQYVLGHTYFMGLKFIVAPGCLIPRPDTELLVEQVLAYIADNKLTSPWIFEVGPGSGCICVSILKKCPSAKATVLEVSAEALAITRQNAKEHGVDSRLTCIEADFFSDNGQEAASNAILDGIDIFVSNPPYINPNDMQTLAPEVKDYEPTIALAGPGSDGMGFYQCFAKILGASQNHLANRQVALMVEVGYDQGALVADLFASSGLGQIRTIKDLSGIQRVVFALASGCI